jgi:hypothetical protein
MEKTLVLTTRRNRRCVTPPSPGFVDRNVLPGSGCGCSVVMMMMTDERIF